MLLSRLFPLFFFRGWPRTNGNRFSTRVAWYTPVLALANPLSKRSWNKRVGDVLCHLQTFLDSRLEVPSSGRRGLFGFLPQYELEIVLSTRAAVPKEAKQRKGRRIEGGGGDGEGKGTLWLCLLSDGRPRIRIGTT